MDTVAAPAPTLQEINVILCEAVAAGDHDAFTANIHHLNNFAAGKSTLLGNVALLVSRQDDVRFVDTLIDLANSHPKKSAEHWTARRLINDLAVRGCLEMLIHVHARQPDWFQAKDLEDGCVLYFAAKNGHMDVLRWRLGLGSFSIEMHGEALFSAISADHVDMIRELLKNPPVAHPNAQYQDNLHRGTLVSMLRDHHEHLDMFFQYVDEKTFFDYLKQRCPTPSHESVTIKQYKEMMTSKLGLEQELGQSVQLSSSKKSPKI